MKRLYVVVRGDLPPGLQLAQACHATREFGLLHPAADVGDNLVVLQAANEPDLCRLLEAALDRAAVAPFHEPDLGGQLTAVAFAGEARAILSCLPLALRAA